MRDWVCESQESRIAGDRPCESLHRSLGFSVEGSVSMGTELTGSCKQLQTCQEPNVHLCLSFSPEVNYLISHMASQNVCQLKCSWTVCYFSWDAATKHQELDGLKQQKSIVVQFWWIEI